MDLLDDRCSHPQVTLAEPRGGCGGGWRWVVLRDISKVTSGGFFETLNMQIELREYVKGHF